MLFNSINSLDWLAWQGGADCAVMCSLIYSRSIYMKHIWYLRMIRQWRSKQLILKVTPVTGTNYLEDHWPCAGGLSAVNVIVGYAAVVARDPTNSGLTRWRLTVFYMDAVVASGRNPVSKHHIQPDWVWRISGLTTRVETAETVSRDQILRHEQREQEQVHFSYQADHEQDWQPFYPGWSVLFWKCWQCSGLCMYVVVVSITKIASSYSRCRVHPDVMKMADGWSMVCMYVCMYGHHI